MSNRIRFVAHNAAPSAEEAYAGSFVPNDLGIQAVRCFTKGLECAVLDTTTEPPTLRLTEAPVNLVEGSLYNQERKFEPYGDKNSLWVYTATGTYQGPGSELELRYESGPY